MKTRLTADPFDSLRSLGAGGLGLGFAVAIATCALALPLTSVAQAPPARMVSLIPAVTDMLIAIGARPQLVAVSSYDIAPEVKDLPRVGALIDPDVERILSLRPDLVVVYGTQQDLIAQLRRASIPMFEYRHGGLAHVTATIRALGERTGRAAQAEKFAGDLEAKLAALKARVAKAGKPRTLLVFGRERGSLRGIYASGGRGFLHDMLEAAGGVNVYADVQAESVQVSSEMILSRAPDVIMEILSLSLTAPADPARDMESWRALSSLPAVRNGRLHLLAGRSINVPGPLVADGVEQMARALHPELFK